MPEKARSVLVLEDNPVQNALYEKILRAGGYEALAITDPLDLVNNLDSLTPGDAILLDVVMPGMDGITVLQHLERHPLWCSVPCLMMTSSPTRDRVVAAHQLPVPPEGFVAKPVEPQSLLQLLRTIIAGQEPIYLLRSFQRKRLSLRLGLQKSLEQLGDAIRENKDAQSIHEKQLAEVRREIQSLQTAKAQLKGAPPETTQSLQLQLQKLEESSNRHRTGIQKAEAQHKEIIRQRQDILYKQKSIRDLERRIEALTQVIKRNRPISQLTEATVLDPPDLAPQEPMKAASFDSGAADFPLSTGTDDPF